MYRRFTVSCIIVCLLCLVVVPLARAEDGTLIAGLHETMEGQDFVTEHDWDIAGYSGVGVCFTANASGELSSVRFQLAKQGALTGYYRVSLWSVNGTPGSGADVNSMISELANQDIALVVDGWNNYTFSGVDVYSGSSYAVVWRVVDDSTNVAGEAGRKITAWHANTPASYNGAGWSLDGWSDTDPFSAEMPAFEVWVSGSEYEWPDLTPADTDSLISVLVWWIIYLIVLLLPAWFLGMYLKMGKWGFIIGLAIGAGLGYAFLPSFPLWLLVLIAVGELSLAYQTVSRGG